MHLNLRFSFNVDRFNSKGVMLRALWEEWISTRKGKEDFQRSEKKYVNSVLNLFFFFFLFLIFWEDSQTPFRIWERLWIRSSEKKLHMHAGRYQILMIILVWIPLEPAARAKLWGQVVYVERMREYIEVDIGESRKAIKDGKPFPQRWLKPMEKLWKTV